jgi:hypothetical protein
MRNKVKRALFETRIGGWLLARLKRAAGLAVVDADQIGQQEVRLPHWPRKRRAMGREKA